MASPLTTPAWITATSRPRTNSRQPPAGTTLTLLHQRRLRACATAPRLIGRSGRTDGTSDCSLRAGAGQFLTAGHDAPVLPRRVTLLPVLAMALAACSGNP